MTHEHAVDTNAAERYLLDEMTDEERDTFEAHFFSCEECGDEMRLASRLRTDAPAIFAAPPTARVLPGPSPERARRRWMPPSVVLPWAAAAVLALALVLQVRPGVPAAVDDGQVVAATALRPATRGAVATVALPPSAQPLALALDVNIGAPGDPLTYALAREDGTAVLSGATTTPLAGAPLVILVPHARLTADASYVVTLTAGGAAPSTAEYRFNTAAAR